VEDVCSTRFIEHVWPLEEARERLTVLAVADETEAGVRRNFVRDAAHVAASAAKQEILRALSHKTQLIDPMRWVRFRTREHSNSMASVIYEV
jgi:dGTP triphosphohydrolase